MGNRLVVSVHIAVVLHIESSKYLVASYKVLYKHLHHEQVAPFQVVIVLSMQQHMNIHQCDLLDIPVGHHYIQF
jgi:hypothetical protein